MSRLIRDTDIIEWIDTCEKKLFPALSKEDGTVKTNLTVVLEAIIATPTAYDVEAAARELEQEKYVAYMKGDVAAMEHNSALNKAIAIVKRGGRDDCV